MIGARRWRWLAAGYLILLLLSHAVRMAGVQPATLPAGMASITVAEVHREQRLERRLLLAYREWGSGGKGSAAPAPGGRSLPVLLLHGSPGSSRDFQTLAPALAGHPGQPAPGQLGPPWLLAPDLPGFGSSEPDIADYSLRAHAAYMIQFLDELRIEQVQVVGFSMGGGVALELARLAPQRVAAVVLLSSIGVQELELLGEYHANHAVHALQFGALWLLHEAVPHFGVLDGAMLDLPYARSFLDSDQRPLRGALQHLEMPVLIVHGDTDTLVPAAAAREHHRLVAHSELQFFPAGHFMIFRQGDVLAPSIGAFLQRASAGTAPTAAQATASRRAAAGLPFDAAVMPRAAGVTMLVLWGLLAAATLISEDLTCITAGIMVAGGRLGLLAAITACFAGILAGDLLLFAAGRILGRAWLGRAPLRWLLSPARVERSSDWFRRRGVAVIFLSRFLPGARLATYFAAGLLRTPFLWFLLYFTLAVAVWTPLLVGAAAVAGAGAFNAFGVFSRWALPGFLLLGCGGWLLLRWTLPLLSWRGRRRWLAWWRRRWRWEFWPLWAFYSPVVIYIAWLGLRHRCLTLFTAANPAIPAAGVIGESKAAILDGLGGTQVARFLLLEAATGAADHAARKAAARAFMDRHGLNLPLVIKPDAGERGEGVVVARSWEAVDAALAADAAPLLVQEYIGGREFGIFWVHLPGDPQGRIFSITEKHFPEVVGNGHSTVEDLILADERAACAEAAYRRSLGGGIHQIPAAGERVRLTELGTHCRGAIFLDGARHRTAALEAAVAALSAPFAGFHFGRYDIKVPDEASLQAGRGLKVIELNGVTSEATAIYDPSHSLLSAYRTLFAQWRLAFLAGQRNQELGVEPVPLLRLLAMARHHRRARRSTVVQASS